MELDARGHRRFSPQEKEDLIKAYEDASTTGRQFAKDHGIGYSTLTHWLRKKRKSSKPGSVPDPWIEVTPTHGFATSTDRKFTLESPSGWRIHLPSQPDLATTRQLMELCSR